MHRTTADGSIGNLYVDRNVSIGRGGTLLVAKDRNAIQEELCNLIEDAGITLSDADDTQLTAAVDAKIAVAAVAQTALIQQKTPVGSVGIYLQSTAPAGVLYLTGATVNRGDFPDLWAWVNANSADVVDNANAAKFGTGDGSTTFRLPDWRGAFLRMTGANGTFQMANGSGFAGGALMVTQNDGFQGHWHDMVRAPGTGSDVRWQEAITGGNTPVDDFAIKNLARGIVTDGTNGAPRTAAETRPFNVAINFGVVYE